MVWTVSPFKTASVWTKAAGLTLGLGLTATQLGCPNRVGQELVPIDAGTPVTPPLPVMDGGMTPPDAGQPDAGLPDAGLPDAGQPDAGQPDAGQPDAGSMDVCGDGQRTGAEVCDDGNTADGDYCAADCAAVTGACGDGVVQTGEACDDGNTLPGDYCAPGCGAITGFCGDSVVQTGEACDDGNTAAGDYCAADCTAVTGSCGDGAVQTGETCDDGNTAAGDYCAADCSAVTGSCGDGAVQTGEACDDGNTTSGDYCAADCSAVTGSCGDGAVQTGEACDDGNTTAGDYCAADCSAVTGSCGDGVVQTGEACDDGNTAAGDYCAADCTAVTGSCGDGAVQTGEVCDDGNTTSGDYCAADCSAVTGSCGDSVVQTGEACDDGNTAAGDYCAADCSAVTGSCGDGVVQTGEACDDGNTAAGDYCAADCTAVTGSCGDGVVQTGEACDDGNTAADDRCAADCTAFTMPAVCGSSMAPVRDLSALGTAIPGGFSVTSDTTGGTRELSTGCGGSGEEHVYAFWPETSGTLSVRVTGTAALNATASVQTVCGAWTTDELGCGPMPFGSGAAGEDRVVLVPNVTADQGWLFVQVDGYASTQGAYTLEVRLVDTLALGAPCATDGHLGTCGTDPVRDFCHDTNADGLGVCARAGTVGEACDAALGDAACVGAAACTAGTCVSTCGNGAVDASEACDDGNTTSGDGCAADCTLEGDTCADAWDLNALSSLGGDRFEWVGSTATFDRDFDASCRSTGGQRDAVARFVAPSTGTWVFAGSALFDLVLEAWSGSCDSGTTAGCRDARLSGQTEYMAVDLTAGDEIFVTVDGYGAAVTDTQSGPFVLRAEPASCGDGMVNDAEVCDDARACADGTACFTDASCVGHGGNEQCKPRNADTCDATCSVVTLPEGAVNDVWDAADVKTLTMSNTGTGHIAAGGDVDVWAVAVTANTPVVFETNVGSPSTCSIVAPGNSTDTKLTVRRADGTQVAFNDDGGVGLCSRATWTPTADETVYVFVERYSVSATSQVRGYFVTARPSVAADTEPNNTTAAAQEVGVDTLVTGGLFITPTRDEDVYRVSLKDGETVRLETYVGGLGSCTAAAGARSDTVIDVLETNGTPISSNDDDGVGLCSLLTYTATADKDVLVRVKDRFTTSTTPIAAYQLLIARQ